MVAILSVVIVALLVIVLAGGYVLIGSNYASTRVGAADSAIAEVHHIDFDAVLGQVGGGFEFASGTSFDARGYSAKVKAFMDAQSTDRENVASDGATLGTAGARLKDSAWLTVLEKSQLDGAAARIGHAQSALSKATAILDDLKQDGDFYSAYAATLVDVQEWGAAVQRNDAAGAIAKVAQMKSDVGKTLQLDGAPGLPTIVHEFLQDFETVIVDIEAIYNANLTGDKAAATTATTKFQTDNQTFANVDTSAVDGAVRSFYQPSIAAYQHELSLASS